MKRKDYPTDVNDDEWVFVAPYLTLMTEDAPRRDYPLREVFNGLRYVVADDPQRSATPVDGLSATPTLVESRGV